MRARACVYSVCGQRDDNGPEGAERGAERYRVRSFGLRVQGATGGDRGVGSHVVFQQQPQPCIPMDTGTAAQDHRAAEEPHPAGLRGVHGRRSRQIPGPVHRQTDHRADWQLQVRRVHVRRRRFHDQEDDGLR